MIAPCRKDCVGVRVAGGRHFLHFRSLYWANQGLLNAVHALQEAEFPPTLQIASCDLKDKLRRTQAIIEETRAVMNRELADWIEAKDFENSR